MSFDTLAPHYRKLEALLAGKILQRARLTYLTETKNSQRALLLGEGHGRFLTELLKTNPQIQIHCIEKSAGMIQAAKKELTRQNVPQTRVTFHQTDALTWQGPSQTYDLIVTNFFLDCFTPDQLQNLIPKIAATATQNAQWLLTDFHIPQTGWQKHRAKIVHTLMYKFFRLATNLPATRLTPPDQFLIAANFQRTHQKLYTAALIHSDLWIQKEAQR